MESEIKKSNGLLIIVIIILIILVLGLVGFIVYDKVISKDTVKSELSTNENATKKEIKKENIIGGYEYTKMLDDANYGENAKLVKQLLLEEDDTFVMTSTVMTDSSFIGTYSISEEKLILSMTQEMPGSGTDCFMKNKDIEYKINSDGTLTSYEDESEMLKKVDDISSLKIAQKRKMGHKNVTNCLDKNKVFTKEEIVGGYWINEINNENEKITTQLILEENNTFTYAFGSSVASGYTGTYEYANNKITLKTSKNMYSSGMDCKYSNKIFEFTINPSGEILSDENKLLLKATDILKLTTANKIKGISSNLESCTE